MGYVLRTVVWMEPHLKPTKTQFPRRVAIARLKCGHLKETKRWPHKMPNRMRCDTCETFTDIVVGLVKAVIEPTVTAKGE